MKYINTLREGDRVNDIYLCKTKQSMMTKNGKPYESLTLQDKTGTVDAKVWEPGSMGIDDYAGMDYILVTGDVTSFQGHLQVNIKRIRKCREGEYDPGEYLPVSGKNIGQMYDELMERLTLVENPYLKQVLDGFFGNETFKKRFCFHSAAKSVHHGYVGGLLEHTLSVVNMCVYMSGAYPILNKDLLLTAAALHDVGKLKELSPYPENDYTDAGQLLGHIVIGSQWVSRKIGSIPNFPERLANELIHCILAHHGELEYGSPKKPALIEAAALNFADNTDARLETMREILEAPGAGDGWLGMNRLLDSNIRKTSE